MPKPTTVATLSILGLIGAYALWVNAQRSHRRAQRLGAAARGKRFVILGGGFAGRNVAEELARLLPVDPAAGGEIILVDETPYLLFTPMLTEAAGGAVDARHIVGPVVGHLPARVAFRRARVEEIDLPARRVTLTDLDTPGARVTLEADHLILALGSVPDYHGVPGLEEHSVAMKRLADAELVRARAGELLARAAAEPDRAARRALLTVVVGGAGYTGVETMAAVNELLRAEARRSYPQLAPGDITTLLVDPAERLMSELKSARLAAYAETKLREAGVQVLLKTKVTAAGEGFVELDGDRRLPTELLIWSGGERPSPLVDKLEGVRRSPHGALEVEATCAVPGHPGVWALGDCAAVPRPDGKGTYAPSAQNATREGTLVAANLVATLCGQPPQPFTYRPIGVLALVGQRAGVAEIYGWPFSGLLAWAMWRAVYVAKMPGLGQRARIIGDWLRDARADPSCP